MGTRSDERPRAVLSPWDAWVLARLDCDLPVDGAAAEVSPPLREPVEAMARHAWRERRRIFRVLLLSQPDREGFLRSIGDIDPKQPRPSAEEQRAWERAGAGPERADLPLVAGATAMQRRE